MTEESQRQKLVKLLKEKGIDDIETKKALDSWTKDQEKKVEKFTGDKYIIAQIELNLKRARLYFEGGYIEEAFDGFEDARMQALNEQNDDLYWKIMNEMNKLEDLSEEQK